MFIYVYFVRRKEAKAVVRAVTRKAADRAVKPAVVLKVAKKVNIYIFKEILKLYNIISLLPGGKK